jgi:hypothetical protein
MWTSAKASIGRSEAIILRNGDVVHSQARSSTDPRESLTESRRRG